MATDDTERANARPDSDKEKPTTGGEAVTGRLQKPFPFRELAEFRASMPFQKRPSVEVLREIRDEGY